MYVSISKHIASRPTVSAYQKPLEIRKHGHMTMMMMTIKPDNDDDDDARR